MITLQALNQLLKQTKPKHEKEWHLAPFCSYNHRLYQ